MQKKIILICLVSILICSCASSGKLRPPPTIKAQLHELTNYNNAIKNLGKMTQAYGAKINLRTRGIIDLTCGFSLTDSQIPIQATKILADTVDNIGGGISRTNKKHLWPRRSNDNIAVAVISGSITRFEKRIYGSAGRTWTNLSQLTIELTLSPASGGPPFPPIISSQSITFSNKGNTVSFSLVGNSSTLKGYTKNRRDNLAAVQLLIESGVVELLGRHLILPFWEALPAEIARVDAFVIHALTTRFANMTETGRIYQFQRLLFLQGFGIPLNGTLDSQTREALATFDNNTINNSNPISLDVYKNLYFTLPVNKTTIERQRLLSQMN